MNKMIRLLAMLVLLSGCAVMKERQWRQWPLLLQEKPAAVLVVVEGGSSVPEHATEYFSTQLPVLVANAGYYAIPPSFSTQLLRNSAYKTSESVLHAPQGAIQQLTGADAILYVRIQHWGARTSLFAQGAVTVAAHYQLISTKTAQVLWDVHQVQELDTTVEQGSWVEDWILTELETSSADITEVARQLNHNVFLALPPGKYNPEYQHWLSTAHSAESDSPAQR